MGIAEQMGRVLQRTSISVNIKERLDFSCALFGPDGEQSGWLNAELLMSTFCLHSSHCHVYIGKLFQAIV